MNLMRGIDLKKIAEKMGGASGAELKVFLSSLSLVPSLQLEYKQVKNCWEFHVQGMHMSTHNRVACQCI